LRFEYFSEFTNDDDQWQIGINGKGSTNLYNEYFLGKYKFTDKITFTGGLHYTNFELSNDNRLEPRLALEFDLPYGINSVNENFPAYFYTHEDESGKLEYINNHLNCQNNMQFAYLCYIVTC
jgi:hypothetical protein